MDELRTIIVETGALDACEDMIERLREEAEAALEAPRHDEARGALSELTVAATTRST